MITIKLKCRKCGRPLEYGTEQVGTDIVIIPHECDSCNKLVPHREIIKEGNQVQTYNKGSTPYGWVVARHINGRIVVTHKDGSGVVLMENSNLIAESLFYRMMDQILCGK